MLLVWVGFACSIFYYVFDRPSPPPSDPTTRPSAGRRTTADDDKLYTGSIILVEHKDRCWLRTMDNRTGLMWDQGYVDCDAVVAAMTPAVKQPVSILRINSISQAFRRGNE